MPLWLALLIGVLAWIPIAFVLACLVGRCIKAPDEPVQVNAARGSSQVALSRLFIVDGGRRDSEGRT